MKKPRNPRTWAKEHNYRKQMLTRADLVAGKDHCAVCKHYTLRLLTSTGQCALHNFNLVRWNAVCDCFDKKP